MSFENEQTPINETDPNSPGSQIGVSRDENEQSLPQGAHIGARVDGQPTTANGFANLDAVGAEPEPKEEETTTKRSRRTRHFTRSQQSQPSQTKKPMSTRNRNTKIHSLAKTNPTLAAGNQGYGVTSVDICATALAGLDESSYQRALMRDANRVLENIVFPMCFPWQHRGAGIPVARNIPCDIDEMPVILAAEDEAFAPFENGPLGHGRFDIGQTRRGASKSHLVNSLYPYCASARRSHDPGVLELTEFTHSKEPKLSDMYFEDLPSKKKGRPLTDDDKMEPGEASLECFLQSQQRKRLRLDHAMLSARTRQISVKVGTCSSRSSILPSDKDQLILEARLPTEVHSGRQMSAAKAKPIAQMLGSYNWRGKTGQANTSSAKSSPKIYAGRMRRVWTEKISGDQLQRGVFAQTLTGEKLENNVQRRPRDVRMVIKIDGNLIRSGEIEHGTDKEQTNVVPRSPYPQCKFDSEVFVKQVESRRTSWHNFKPRGFGLNLFGKEAELRHVMPFLDCVCDINGFVSVVCTEPGRFTYLDQTTFNDLMLFASRGDSTGFRRCAICWSDQSNDIMQNMSWRKCYDCGITVHAKCTSNKRGRVTMRKLVHIFDKSPTASLKWRCEVCTFLPNDLKQFWGSVPPRKSGRESRVPARLQDSQFSKTKRIVQGTFDHDSGKPSCTLCPFLGGAMSRTLDENGRPCWRHETCHIWTKSVPHDHLKDKKATQCALCGNGDDGRAKIRNQGRYSAGLVKCAAARCCVYFHPMCAIAATLVGDEERKSRAGKSEQAFNNAKEQLWFSLSAMQCQAVIARGNQQRPMSRVETIPVAFCSLHHPKRPRRKYGLYPDDRQFDKYAIRVPSIAKHNGAVVNEDG